MSGRLWFAIVLLVLFARTGERSLDAQPRPVAPVPSAPRVCTPRPFVPPGTPTGWRHTRTALLTVTQGPANHRGQDVLVVPGAPQRLVGKFAYGLADKDLKRETVEVFVQSDPPCGAWESLGTAKTSKDREHGAADDGGRVFFTIPRDKARPVGWHPVRMLVHGDHSVAALNLVVVPPGTETVVFDIDGTLTITDFELVRELFEELFRGVYAPEMFEGAVQVADAWAKKGYLLVYLTGRPHLLTTRTREWLVARGFPTGVLHHSEHAGDVAPVSSGVAAYKAAFLAETVKGASVALRAAYGNATTDIEAYAKAMIPKDKTFIIGRNAGAPGTAGIGSYVTHLPAVERALPAAAPVPLPFGW